MCPTPGFYVVPILANDLGVFYPQIIGEVQDLHGVLPPERTQE